MDGLNRVRRVEELIYEVTSKQGYKTFRKGVLNFAGKISKILFDTLYNEQIERFKQNADSLTELTKTHTHTYIYIYIYSKIFFRHYQRNPF